jgi:uncharacterized protein (TIGR02118 family)
MTMKTVGLMPRKPDITRARFRMHYEDRHAPLAISKFPFDKYVRNHVVSSDPDPVGFDCLSEFWVDQVDEIYRLMAGPVGDIMREDELRFTDQPNIGPAVAEETLVAGPARVVERDMTNREILLLRPAEGVSKVAFVGSAVRWGKALAAGSPNIQRITFDTVAPFEGRPFPAVEGILYGWVDKGGAVYDAKPPADIVVTSRIRTESIESRF